LLPPELPFLTQICTKSFVGWGFAPDPTGGAYSAPPDPIAEFRWPLLRERRGEIGQRMGLEEGEGKRRGKRRGKGRGGKWRAPMTLWHGAPNVLIRPWTDGQRDGRTDGRPAHIMPLAAYAYKHAKSIEYGVRADWVATW